MMGGPRRAANKTMTEAGWTLIEMLIALVLLSLITILVTSSVYSSRRAIDQAEIRNDEISVGVVETYLRQALSQAQPVKPLNSAVDAPLIEAHLNELRLITSYAPAGRFGGLYAIDLHLARNNGNRSYDLVETRTLYRPQPDPGLPGPARPSSRSYLLQDVSAIRFHYFGIRDDHQEIPEWYDEWTHPTQLPNLIELQVSFARGDGRRWFPLIVALPVGR
jgi:general secretion pathway protein J